LRLNEALHLQIGDIDAQRKMVHIHRGKGAKDRYVPISQFTIEALRRYWVTHRHQRFLFPADGRNHALRPGKLSTAKTPMSMTVHDETEGGRLKAEASPTASFSSISRCRL
jgi:integrase